MGLLPPSPQEVHSLDWRRGESTHTREPVELKLVQNYNLFMKEGSLFCSHEIHQTGMLQIMLLVSLESSQ
jgi:hypothetical protein